MFWKSSFRTTKCSLNSYDTESWDGCYMVLNATFNTISVISWRSVLLVEETGVSGENRQPDAGHWQTLSHYVVSNTPLHEQNSELTTLMVIGTDYIGSCKCSWYLHIMITTLTALIFRDVSIKRSVSWGLNCKIAKDHDK